MLNVQNLKKKKKLCTLNIQNYIHYLKFCAVQCTKFCILFEKLITLKIQNYVHSL